MIIWKRDDGSFNNNSLTNGTKFIPLCDTGPKLSIAVAKRMGM
jgi:hypothetical protein